MVTYPTVFDGLSVHFPDITFIKKDDLKIDYDSQKFIVDDETMIIPMRWSDQIMKVNYRACMLSKYMLVNLPFGMWRSLQWKRDLAKEERLSAGVLRIRKGERYRLISDTYMSDRSGLIKIPNNPRIKNVKVSQIAGFTLLDWGRVIENAEEIHMVNSAILLLLELLPLKCRHPHIYIRAPQERDHNNYAYMCSKDYIFEKGRT